MTQRTLAAVIALLVLGPSTAAAGRPSQAPLRSDDTQPGMVATIDVGGTPLQIAATARAVWVATGLGGVARIDTRTNRKVASLRPGGTVIDVASGLGGVWAVDVFRDRLLRIDPRTNRVAGQTRVPAMPSGVAVGHGRVWVVSQLASTLSAVDPSNGKVVAVGQFRYGELWPGGLAVGAGGVWVITASGNEVTLIDPSTFDIVRRVSVAGARTLAIAGNALWVGVARGERVLRIDRGSIVRVPAPGRSDGYGAPLAGGTALRLAVAGGIVALDPRDGSVVCRIPIPPGHRMAAIAAALDVWVADETAGTVLRLGPRPCSVARRAAAGRR